MPNIAFDHGYAIGAAISGTGSGAVSGVSMTGTSGILLVWVLNSNTTANASGSTAPAMTGNSGAGSLNGTWTKIKSQTNGGASGFITLDLWANTWTGGALTNATITISSMPANTGSWAMTVEGYSSATGNETPSGATYSTQNASSPSVTTGNNNDLVVSGISYSGGPTAGPSAGAGYTLDAAASAQPALNIYTVFRVEYANAVTATSGTVVTPGWTGEGGAPTASPMITVALMQQSAPTAPGAPTYGTNSHNSVVVNLPSLASTGATSYTVQKSTDNVTFNNAPGGTGQTGATYTDTSTGQDDTQLYYRLIAVNGVGSTTGTASSTFGGPPVPGTPTVGTVNDTQVKVTMPTTTSSIDSFNLQRSANAGSTWSTVASGVGAGSVVTDSTTAGNTNYLYRAQATNNSGGGVTNGAATSNVLTAPSPPSGLALTPSSSGPPQITGTFTPAAGASGVNVYRSTASNGSYTQIIGGSNVQGSSFIDKYVQIGQNYWYILTSINSLGEESVLASPSGPAAVTQGQGGFTLERAVVYEGCSLFPEVTPGTAGAATKRLLCTDFQPDIVPDIRKVRAQGEKFDTDVAFGKEYTTGKIGGYLAFYDVVYLLSSLMCSATVSTPLLNTWNITGASGTIGFDVVTATAAGTQTQTLAAASYANAAALQTAIGSLSNVGAGQVTVTGAAPSYQVAFSGYLSTGTATLQNPTGTPTPTLARAATATNTRRWTFSMNPYGPESAIQTYTLEKGIPNTANLAQQISQVTVTALTLRITGKEATKQGDFIGMTAVDPFTMTTQSSITQVTSKPINSKDTGVFVGTALLGANGLVRMARCMEYEWGCTNRATPVITLDDSVSSFSNTVEAAGVEWTQRMALSQDSVGQATLAGLRAGTPYYRVVENKGLLIETGFPHRFKITECVNWINGPKKDVDGLYVGDYESTLRYDPVSLGAAVKVEVDVNMTAL